MLTALGIAAFSFTPQSPPPPPAGREAAARVLKQRLAPLEELSVCAHRFPMLVEAVHDAADELGDGVFEEQLREIVLGARWRAVTDPAAAQGRLERELERALSDLEFRPLEEGVLPEGFPVPTPVRAIELKPYPAYRMARAPMEGGRERGAFWSLFQHIQRNDIPMTAPVEVSYGEAGSALREVEMAFLYQHPRQGHEGDDRDVVVVDVLAMLVVSLGGRGRRDDAVVARARERLLRWVEARDALEVAGPLRVLGYNSPMVPASRRTFEVQLPVRSARRAEAGPAPALAGGG